MIWKESLSGSVLALVLVLTIAPDLAAEPIRVAVASNFRVALEEVAERFEHRSGHEVVLISGSTGKHYAQITHGAPFELFFAADDRRPRLLEEQGLAVAGSRFTYGIGQLVLWSPQPGYVDAGGAVLENGDFRFLAIANPELAPYGRAAKEVLEGLGLWGELDSRLVRGENVGQAFQFVASGNAELGLVALSQIRQGTSARGGSLWEVPRDLYGPIEQQVVLLRESEAAMELLEFVRGDEARAVLRDHGYDLPELR